MTHVGSVVISGEANCYRVAVHFRDHRPTNTTFRLAPSDIMEGLGDELNDKAAHDLWEISLHAAPGHEQRAEQWFRKVDFESINEHVLWAETMLPD